MFRRRHAEGGEVEAQPSELGINETLGPEMTVVGRGAQLEGTLVSAESIRIYGQAKGKIAAQGDVILSSDSHVEADIQAQNVVSGGTLKGSITARTRTELAQGGRVEGTIRSKVLVVRDGAQFSGQASIDLEDAPGEADGSAYPEDELRVGYDEAVRRAAEWYRSSLFGPEAGRDHGSAEAPDVAGISEPDETTPELGEAASLSRLAYQRIGAGGEAPASRWTPPSLRWRPSRYERRLGIAAW
ncbi:MAG: polymer-forming cytoskeletal protein [Actinobacteria bacterium]|nr:polymer-forming cytoskeletal protein [Actinomycetota bacterium]